MCVRLQGLSVSDPTVVTWSMLHGVADHVLARACCTSKASYHVAKRMLDAESCMAHRLAHVECLYVRLLAAKMPCSAICGATGG